MEAHMTNEITKTEIVNSPQASQLENVLVNGDLSKLTAEQRTSYYMKVCESVGLNPLTKPFEYITLNGKLQLYALRTATDQLRKVHNVSINITGRQTIDGVYVVTAKAKLGEREDESTGAVATQNLKGDALANAYLKAETKAKRRVTLSICGLGVLDETEVETIKEVGPKQVTPPPEKKNGPIAQFMSYAKNRGYPPPMVQDLVLRLFRKTTMAGITHDELKDLNDWVKNHPPEEMSLLEKVELDENGKPLPF